MNWAEFFHMGGYALYVWSAWGLTLAVLLWQITQPKLRNARIRRMLARQFARQKLVNSTEAKHNSKKP